MLCRLTLQNQHLRPYFFLEDEPFALITIAACLSLLLETETMFP
jgi:hypothetical protein